MVDKGSTDNCSSGEALVQELSQTSFRCSDVGTHTVQYTVTDAAGNETVVDVEVTVNELIDQSMSVSSTVSTLCPSDENGRDGHHWQFC